jgi:hypothetical protein
MVLDPNGPKSVNLEETEPAGNRRINQGFNTPDGIRTSDLWFRRLSLKRYVDDSSRSVLFHGSRFCPVFGGFWAQIGLKFFQRVAPGPCQSYRLRIQ